jgi:hypothetical protein
MDRRWVDRQSRSERSGLLIAGEALPVANGGVPGPAAGGDDAECERDKPAATQDDPGGAAGAHEFGAGHYRPGDGDADRRASEWTGVQSSCRARNRSSIAAT